MHTVQNASHVIASTYDTFQLTPDAAMPFSFGFPLQFLSASFEECPNWLQVYMKQ